MKIRSQITLSFIVVYVLIVSVIIFVIGWTSKRIITDLVYRRIEISSRIKAAAISTYLQQEFESVKLLTGASEVSQKIKEILIVDTMGKILESTEATDEGKNYEEVTGKIEKNFNGIQTGEIGLTGDKSENYVWVKSGMIVGKIGLAEFKEIMTDKLNDFVTFDTFLINRDKFLLTETRFLTKEEIFKKQLLTVNTAACFSGRPEPSLVTFADYRGIQVVGTRAYIPELDICLITKVDEAEVLSPYRQLILTTGIIFLIALAIFVMTGFLVSGRITRTLDHLMRHVQRLQNGEMKNSVDVTSKDEVGVLASEIEKIRQQIVGSEAEIRRQVKEQTEEIIEKSKAIENQQSALTNILEDVTEERDRTARERDKSDAILYSIGDGVFVVDENKKIVLINKMALKLAQLIDDKSVIGKTYSEVFRFTDEKDERVVQGEFIDKAISLGEIQEITNNAILIGQKGKRIPVADSAAPLKDANGKIIGCVVVFRDVSRERELDRLKDDFVSMTSHELRTPLGAIKGFASMMLEGDYGVLNVATLQPVKDILTSSERMIRLVNDLLNLSRIESGKIKYKLIKINLTDLFKETVSQLQPLVVERGLGLVVKGEIKTRVQADDDKVRQIIINLIGNAVKFTEQGKIKISVMEGKDEVKILVADTGIGIKTEDQVKLFKKFERLGERVDAKYVSTGLGLYVSREIVRKMGGDLWLEKSEVGKGSVFAFSLPVFGSETAKEVATEIEAEAKGRLDQKELI